MRVSNSSVTVDEWTQEAPRRAPFASSTHLLGLRRTGHFVSYTGADTWYPSWGSDDRLYTPFTDGIVCGVGSGSGGDAATTGHAVITGQHPIDLQITCVGTVPGSPAPYGGRYPSASLMHDGVWYYGTYCLAETGRGLNWDILGPFVGFRTSDDGGTTWKEGPHTPAAPLLGESGALSGEPVRMGAPHFVDLGKNMEHSPDGYAYLVGHGSAVSSGTLSWISGDEITLGRVRPTPQAINDPQAYEWAAGRTPDGTPRWVSSLADAKPIASWPGHMGCVTATYVSPLGRYLMCVTDGWPTIKEMDSYVLEAEDLIGPWRMVAYMDKFGEQGYFLNFPSRFISDDGKTLWLCYSANFTNGWLGTSLRADPEGSRYGMCLLQLELLTSA